VRPRVDLVAPAEDAATVLPRLMVMADMFDSSGASLRYWRASSVGGSAL
jgi:hypothetical protein